MDREEIYLGLDQWWRAAGLWPDHLSSYRSPHPPLFPFSQSTSLSRWHFGKSHCHTTFNKDKIVRWAPWMTGLTACGAGVQSIRHTSSFTHVLRVLHWERPAVWVPNTAKAHKQVCASMRTNGTSAHQHTDALAALKYVSFSLFFSSSLDTMFIYVHHLPCLSDGCFLSAVSRSWLKQKKQSEACRFWIRGSWCWLRCPWRSIPILLTHTLAANSNRWESKPHTAPPWVPLVCPGQTFGLLSFPLPLLSFLLLNKSFSSFFASSVRICFLWIFSLAMFYSSSINPSVQRYNSRLLLEERTFHLPHTLTSLSLMNVFIPLVYKTEGLIHNQAHESMYTQWTSW